MHIYVYKTYTRYIRIPLAHNQLIFAKKKQKTEKIRKNV